MNRIVVGFVLCLSFFAHSAFAQTAFTQLSVVPAAANPHTPLHARSLFQFCQHQEEIGQSTVTRAGNVLTLRIQMLPQPSTICFSPPPPRLLSIPIGSFEPGIYTLVQQADSPNPNIVYPSMTTSFTVAPAPLSVPASSTMSTLLLALLIGVGAYLGMLAGRDD